MTKKRIEETYKKLTQQEHVLTRPDTYVGSTEPSPNMVWIANQDYSCERKEITFSPAFLKIFDEILTNASDHAIRTGKVKKIEIEVNSDYISVKNDGPGIPVEEHKEEKLWVPEMIFGHLLTGSNYDDSEDRMVGGRNGLGAKLTNIFSTKFVVKTRDGKKHFSGTWKGNMGKMSNKKIKDDTGKPFTEIKYYPEWSRFGMDGMDDDVSSLLLKRAMDIAAFLPKVKVRYNKKEIPVKNFQQWMKLHLPEDSEVFYEQLDENWTVGLAPSPTETFESVSVVNGVSTYKGGTHVNWFSLESSKALCDQILKGKSKIRLSWAEVKTHLFAFVCCNIPNPTFDSQTKENLTNRMSSNITPPEPSQKFIKKVSKSSVVQSIMEWVEAREQARLKRELASSGSSRRVKIDKLEDAHKAGTAKSSECFLFLTEGDCLEENTGIKIYRDGKSKKVPIKDINIGDGVLSHDGTIGIVSSITSKVSHGIKISYKDKQLLVSPKHKMYVYDTSLDQFNFIEAAHLDKNRHKLVRNKLVDSPFMLGISDVSSIKDDRYDYIISTELSETIECTEDHRFYVYDEDQEKFIVLVANQIIPGRHYFVCNLQ